MSKIIYIHAREIIDSRGNPTVEVEVETELGGFGRASVPSGASKGEREALELRDNNRARYNGKGVLHAIKNINGPIARGILKEEYDVFEQQAIDRYMIKLDGSKYKSKLGANAILGVSLAVAHAAANELGMPLFRYLGGPSANLLPTPMLNIINGGVHADNSIDFQEFMIIPIGAESFSKAIQMAAEVYHELKAKLKAANHNTNVGDEGGFAPNCSAEQALEFIIQAIKAAGYNPARKGKNAIAIGLDVAASELYKDGKYHFTKLSRTEGREIVRKTDEMINYYRQLCIKYPIISIEDGLAESDAEGFQRLTHALGDEIQIVGDDLFVTNPEILKKGIQQQLANSILIKVNQIGTLTETFEAIDIAKKAG